MGLFAINSLILFELKIGMWIIKNDFLREFVAGFSVKKKVFFYNYPFQIEEKGRSKYRVTNPDGRTGCKHK